MIENNDIKNLKELLIKEWTGNDYLHNVTSIELPEYLKNTFLTNLVASQSKTIIQVFDMQNFKTVYTSPNCIEITGFTDVELNNIGFTYWLKTISLKQIFFYIKSAQFVNKNLKKLEENNLFFANQCINLGFKNKKGEKRSMISSNTCIEWNGNKQKYQLILWRDMTEKFKNQNFSVNYSIGSQKFHYWAQTGKFKQGNLFTEKEKEMIRFYELGQTSKEIAAFQDLSIHTVDNHKKNIMNKMSVSTMQDAYEIGGFLGLF